MIDANQSVLDRRQLLGSGLVLGALVGTPLWFWSKVRQGQTGEATDDDRQMLTSMCDLVLPRTNTPGASDVGVPEFVILALNHGLDGTRQPGTSAAINAPVQTGAGTAGLYILDDLATRLAIKAGGDFNAASPAQQFVALSAIDAFAFGPSGGKDPWHKIKDLILTGYYTSEVGGSQELRYELVPGRWDSDIPLKRGDRAFSSDWTAVDFG